MKKISIFMLVLAVVAPSMAARAKFDGPALQLLGSAVTPQSRTGEFRYLPSAVDASEKITYILTFDDENTAERLTALGYDIFGVRGNMAMASLTVDEVYALGSEDGVLEIAAGYSSQAHMRVARQTTGVNDIQTGTGLDKSYDGTGVIVGMMDTGIDPQHANFTDAEGNCRISRMWYITGQNSSVREFSTPDAIKNAGTDKGNETHATHVLGIMGGSFNGKGKVATYNDRTGRPQTSNSLAVPYYGVATGAELAPATGTFEGQNINVAADRLLAYAQSKGKPAVFNLSLGHNFGPHDGTSAANRYLEEMGKKMIICVSAGNEGAGNIAIKKDFTAASNNVKTVINGSVAIESGQVDIWGSDKTPLKVTLSAVDKTTGATVYSYTISKPEAVIITGSYYTAPGYIHSQDFDDVFGTKGAVWLTASVGSNNRYNVYCQFQTERGNKSTNIVPALIVEGSAGKAAYIYANGSCSLQNAGLSGYTAGTSDGSISDLACGKNIISVGAYTNVKTFNTVNGERTFKGATVGAIAPFSSYGTTFDGRTLPIITGPGLGIISSYSTYYMNGSDVDEGMYCSAIVDKNGRKSYWKEMSGTSMSSPFVAGVCALWLQADPTLTVDDIKAVMKETADKDEFTAVSPERWGYGKINALAGIKKILGSSGIAGVLTEGSDMIVTSAGGSVEVFAAGAGEIRVELYTVGGVLAAQTVASGDTAVLEADGLAKGVYVLRAVADGTRTATRKIVL